MRRSYAAALIVLITLTLALVAYAQPAPQPSATAPSYEVYVSPHGGCAAAVVKELDAAKESVLVQAYEFTFAPIAKALLDANKRGVKVQVILDKSQRTEKY